MRQYHRNAFLVVFSLLLMLLVSACASVPENAGGSKNAAITGTPQEANPDGVCGPIKAEITWFGLARGKLFKESSANPNEVPGGVQWEKRNMQRIKQTSHIPLRGGNSVMVYYRLTGLDTAKSHIFKSVTIFPKPGMVDKSGRAFSKTESKFLVKPGPDSFSNSLGWHFDGQKYGYEMVPGEWKFQLWHNGCLLLEKTFLMSKPQK